MDLKAAEPAAMKRAVPHTRDGAGHQWRCFSSLGGLVVGKQEKKRGGERQQAVSGETAE
jgi:hypothetical protein